MCEHADDRVDGKADAQGLPTVEALRRLIEADAAAQGIEPDSNVKFIDLPGLLPTPEESGLFDGPDPQDNYEPRELREIIDGMGDEELPPIRREPARREPVGRDPMKRRALPFRPFPSGALPEPVRGFVDAGAEAIGCEASCVALPMLAGLAAAIGNTRELRLKRGWSVPSIIWSAIVGEKATSKSAAFRLALKPFQQRRKRADDRHAAALRQYKSDLADYEKARADWERILRGEEPVPRPVRPQAERSIVNDTTVEALAPLLAKHSRGLLLALDELAGWVASFARSAAQSGHWLAMHKGASIVIDRKTQTPGSISVERAAVCVTGCLKPADLRPAENCDLTDRLLLSWPPYKHHDWIDAELDPAAEAKIAGLIERLYELKGADSAEGETAPVTLELTPEAKSVWKRFYNAHARQRDSLPSELSAAWSKLAEYAARLALVVHCVRFAAEEYELEDAERVDAASLNAAIELIEWFRYEARRVHARGRVSGVDASGQKLMDWILHKGGTVTVRDVQRALSRYRTATDAEAALQELVEAGEGRWEVARDAQTGPSTRRFSAFFTDRL